MVRPRQISDAALVPELCLLPVRRQCEAPNPGDARRKLCSWLWENACLGQRNGTVRDPLRHGIRRGDTTMALPSSRRYRANRGRGPILAWPLYTRAPERTGLRHWLVRRFDRDTRTTASH